MVGKTLLALLDDGELTNLYHPVSHIQSGILDCSVLPYRNQTSVRSDHQFMPIPDTQITVCVNCFLAMSVLRVLDPMRWISSTLIAG